MQDTLQPASPQRKNGAVIIEIVTVVVVLALCTTSFILILSRGEPVATNEVPAMQQAVDDFILVGTKQDAAAGYALFAPEAHRQFAPDKVQEMFAQTQLFDQFQSTTVMTASISSNVPTGSGPVMMAQIEGSVNYRNSQGTFKAELMKVGNRWMLFNINITH